MWVFVSPCKPDIFLLSCVVPVTMYPSCESGHWTKGSGQKKEKKDGNFHPGGGGLPHSIFFFFFFVYVLNHPEMQRKYFLGWYPPKVFSLHLWMIQDIYKKRKKRWNGVDPPRDGNFHFFFDRFPNLFSNINNYRK